MERLTQRSTWDGGIYFTKKPKGFFCYENPCSQAVKCEKVDDKTCPHLAVLERLAEYEDTGLGPESVKQMQDVFGRGLTFLEDARERLEIIEGISTDRLCELVEADREERCYITTVKIGERVFLPNEKGEIIGTRVQGISLPVHGGNLIIHLGGYPAEYLWSDREGKDWWKTRRAAEVALKGELSGK